MTSTGRTINEDNICTDHDVPGTLYEGANADDEHWQNLAQNSGLDLTATAARKTTNNLSYNII